MDGTAIWPEQIALPPDAVFEAVLEEASRADARAIEIGETRIENPGQPPVAFSIAYDPAQIDDRLTYVVRARVLARGRLILTSDKVHRVLTRGAPAEVAITMRTIGGGADARGVSDPGASGAHGLRLPATFVGDMPCADCAGIRYHLNLWPDQVFELRLNWLGIDESRDSMGRWSVEPESRALMLWATGEFPTQFAILNNQHLRLLDMQGRPISSDLSYELASLGALEPIANLHLGLAGEFVYMADAARLTECQTGRSYPVAMEGDFLTLERAYTETRSGPGEPLLVTLEVSIVEKPKMEGEGTEPTLVVNRFVNVWPNETCERNRAEASLTNTYWRIVRFGGEDVRAQDGKREPHILLHTGEPPRFSGTVGCNQFIGGYEISGQSLQFGAVASTMMACPPPLDALERALSDVLKNTAGWSITAQFLEFRDAQDKPLALFQAVYLP